MMKPTFDRYVTTSEVKKIGALNVIQRTKYNIRVEFLMTKGFLPEDVKGYIGSWNRVNDILRERPHLKPLHCINPWQIIIQTVHINGNTPNPPQVDVVESLDTSGRAYAYANRLYNLMRTYGHKKALSKINHSGWNYLDWVVKEPTDHNEDYIYYHSS